MSVSLVKPGAYLSASEAHVTEITCRVGANRPRLGVRLGGIRGGAERCPPPLPSGATGGHAAGRRRPGTWLPSSAAGLEPPLEGVGGAEALSQAGHAASGASPPQALGCRA